MTKVGENRSGVAGLGRASIASLLICELLIHRFPYPDRHQSTAVTFQRHNRSWPRLAAGVTPAVCVGGLCGKVTEVVAIPAHRTIKERGGVTCRVARSMVVAVVTW